MHGSSGNKVTSDARYVRTRRRHARIVLWSVVALALILFGENLRRLSPQEVYISARPHAPTQQLEPGEHELGLGGPRWVNRGILWRDGLLYIPSSIGADSPRPLLVWLHGGGGRAEQYRKLFPLAEEVGVVVLALDARHNTWDAFDSPWGPDVRFIDESMRHVFDHAHIDPNRIALGGLSDGASYALALGRVNGNLFTHLIAAAPGGLRPPAPPVGNPKILVVHGTRDNVYNILGSRLHTVPRLKEAGYQVEFLEFDGPHSLPPAPARKVLQWLVES